ncbi:MAG: transcriptional repressor [Chloroflexi bacterium]|nr:transcriptional repressor [Chloroflexota bacterium]MBI5293435.1 transcriptional repressor [Chloroflexota bacterium]
MTHQTLDYATVMRERGCRVTPQRQLILDAVCDGGGHTTPDEVYARVQARAPAVNRTTVYRTLDFLCEMRLVVAAQIGGHMFYEIAGATPHHHLVCRKCDKVDEIGHDAVKSFFARIERDRQFLIDMDHLALFGLCQDCRREPER